MLKKLLRLAGLSQPDPGALTSMPPDQLPPERRMQQRVPAGTPGQLCRVDEAGLLQHEAILLCDASSQGVRIRLPQPLAIHQTEWLDIGRSTHVKAVVRYCWSQEEGYIAGLRIIGAERRRDDRRPVRGDSRLTWDSGGAKVTIPATVLNATSLGLQLQTKTAVPPAVVASVTGEDTQCIGSVCYCVSTSDGFLAGLHLTRPAYSPNSADYRG